MPYFKDSEVLYKCLGALFKRVSQDDVMGEKLAASGIIVRFIYKDPEGVITINTQEKPEDWEGHFRVIHGANDLKPDVTMSMKADIGHKFWHGKVNLLQAVNRRQIIPKGPMAKIFKLLPIVQPTYKIYPVLLEEIGEGDLVMK